VTEIGVLAISPRPDTARVEKATALRKERSSDQLQDVQ
jgi:hypothetical protein